MRRQSGVALLVVLLILALMMLVAGNMSSRFFLAMQRSSAQQMSLTGYWYVRSGEALVAKTLLQDIKDQPNKTDLSQYWATDGQVFPLENGDQLAGQVRDGQACYNLNGINAGTSGVDDNDDGEGNLPYEAQVFRHLLMALDVESFTATQITEALRDWIDRDSNLVSSNGAEDSYYEGRQVPYLPGNTLMQDVSELRAVRGVSASLYRRLAPYICALPTTSLAVNVNTLRPSQAALLSALFLGRLDEEEARTLIEGRASDGWDTTSLFLSEEAITGLSGLGDKPSKVITIVSHYFDALIEYRTDERRLLMHSLFKRTDANKLNVIRRQYGGVE